MLARCVIAALAFGIAGCTYLGIAAKQAGYSLEMKKSPTQRVYKHMLETENFFVFGRIEHKVGMNKEAVAVVAVSDLHSKNEVVETCHFSRIDSYYGFNLPAGEYRLLVVSDRNRDGFYDEKEVIGGRLMKLESKELPDKVMGGFDIDLNIPFPASLRGSFRLPVKKPPEIEQSLFFPRGTIRSLDDEIFSQKMSSLGMYEPAAFMEEAPMMFYALEENLGYKIPVVFVHGIDGSPRDFAEITAHLDRSIYNPWFFYYPSGIELSRLSELFYRIFLSGEVIPLQDTPMVIVAHSMGGLVVRDALNRYDGKGKETIVRRFITIATPMAGHPAATMGNRGPVQIPSWRDLAPDSEFMGRLRRKKIPDKLEYHLLYAYGNTSSVKLGENSDGVVPLSSQLCSQAQDEAKAQSGFNDTHTGILKNPDAVRKVMKIIEEVRPIFPEDHLRELVKGGYQVDLGKEFTPLERYWIGAVGKWMDALASGAITPFLPDQTHFVQVSRGEKSPENESETAWAKFIRKYPDRSGLNKAAKEAAGSRDALQ